MDLTVTVVVSISDYEFGHKPDLGGEFHAGSDRLNSPAFTILPRTTGVTIGIVSSDGVLEAIGSVVNALTSISIELVLIVLDFSSLSLEGTSDQVVYSLTSTFF